MNIIDRLNRHPIIFTIILLGAIASIISILIALWPNNHASDPLERPIEPKGSWGISREYTSGGEHIIEGWLTIDTLTWGATIPLPPFKEPPNIDFWRVDGAGISKPQIVNRTADQFTVKIANSDQSGKWMWRVRGTRAN